ISNGTKVYNEYTYTAFNAAAMMQSPTPGSTLTANSVTFTGNAGTNVTGYRLDVGNVAGGNQWYYAAPGAVMQTPTGSTLSGTSATFTWGAGGATLYQLTVGSTYGGSDIYSSEDLDVLTTTVSNLPANGSPIYVTLYSEINGSWVQNYYSYVSGP
ncbi:MAG TPA: hypothetical protein VEH47_05340, partial [Candidatus Acidoferrales bacterium]|nr:hypothetical protein [Candidatus Acidoferrales bacterium]